MTEPKGEGAPAGGIKMGDLRKMIQDTVTDVMKGVTVPTKGEDTDTPKGGGTQADRATSIASAVQAEIEKIRAKEKEDDDKKTIQDKLNELSAATAEKPPVERSRVHKFMGWGENAK
jgi:hypothetical protein